MGKNKKKSKKAIPFTDFNGISSFLRELAEYFQDGSVSGNLELIPPRDDFFQLGITIKRKEGKFIVKYKSKEIDLEAERQRAIRSSRALDSEKPDYKVLKKRMKVSFREIKTALLENRNPDESVTREFLADSELMISYPGYGDDYYDDYRKACHDFQVAFERLNTEAMGLAFLKLDVLRHDCHERHL